MKFKMTAYRYKLSVLLFTVVLLISGFLGFFQFLMIQNSLNRSFEQQRQLVTNRVLNIVHDADYINLLLEKPLEAHGREILSQVSAMYDKTGDIRFPLTPFLAGYEKTQLYIISADHKVVATTDPKDMGLDFTPWTAFVAYLEQVQKEGRFATSRMSLSIRGGEMTKYCYQPSSDGKYVFETGALIDVDSEKSEEIRFDNFEERVARDSDIVSQVTLFDYEGVAYKKDAKNESLRLEDAFRPYFTQAMTTMSPVEVRRDYQGKPAVYQYLPYKIIGATGVNEQNVVEVIYSDAAYRRELRLSLGFIILLVAAGALVAGTYGFRKARGMTRPVEIITEGVKQVAAGRFDGVIQVDSGDEFSLLAGQFNQMTAEIRKLLEERYRSERSLEEKNAEIFEQKEEITSLYEETAALNEELENLLAQNENSYFETVRALANAIEEKDAYTGGHCERVMHYATMIAETMQLNRHDMTHLRFGSILHDVGKIGISEQILNKEGQLTREEYDEIRRHPEKGNHILENLFFLEDCRKIVLQHHERVDGKGYPEGLSGTDIGLLARIVCVADAYDAMTSIRPYRKNALPEAQAIEELIRNSGSQFDKDIVEVFVKALREKQRREQA